MEAFVAFLNGNIFGYLLHAIEISLAEFLFCFYLKKRSYFALRGVICVAAYLSLSIGFGMLLERFFPYFRFLIAFPLSLIFFPICYKSNIWDILFCCVAAIVMQNLAYSVGGFVVGCCGWDPVKVNALYTAIQTVIYIGVTAVCFVVCARRLKNIGGGFGEERLPMVILLLILTLIIYIVQHDRQTLDAEDYIWWRAMFICYDVMALFMLFGIYDRIRLRKEKEMLDTIRKSEEQQYEIDKRTIEMVNIKCHDLKHQLIALRQMDVSEQNKALTDIEEAVVFYDAIAKTGCKPLDVILSNKSLLCEKYSIHFTYMIDGKKLNFMEVVDIYSLFGNALDNAIRAESSIEDKEKRLINVTVTAHGKILTVNIENYYEGNLIFRNGLPVTTQQNSDVHGFGMISMKNIVERYGGVMAVAQANNMVCLDITIPIK